MLTLGAVEQWATFIAFCTSLIAACLWLWASRTPIPTFPDVGFDSDSSVFEPVRSALLTASRRNAYAAFISAVAALALGVAALCHWLQPLK
jgi:hypothetical protein